MPTRTTAPAGLPCWIDLMSSDTARSRDYYSQLLGWSAEEPNAEFGGYFNFTKDGAREAGCMASQPGQGPSDIWSIYLQADDATKTLEMAAANGGQVLVPAMPVADLGTMGMVVDPAGASIGIWQPGTFQGFSIYAEDGSPGWFELHTRDFARSLEFYQAVFGWEIQVVSDTPEFRYVMAMDGEEGVAGLMDASAMLPEGAPSQWSVYFSVDDADAAVERTTRLGGTITRPAEDTPYGRLAEAVDVNGAVYKLVGANEAMPARG